MSPLSRSRPLRGVLLRAVPALIAGAGALAAQATPAVGERVRYTTTKHRFEGRLLDRLAKASLVSLERQVGRKSRFLRGAAIGALAGGVSGGLLGAIAGGGGPWRGPFVPVTVRRDSGSTFPCAGRAWRSSKPTA